MFANMAQWLTGIAFITGGLGLCDGIDTICTVNVLLHTEGNSATVLQSTGDNSAYEQRNESLDGCYIYYFHL